MSLHILDLTAKGAAPRPIAGVTKGAHDAVFGADGAIWYLAPVGGQDQLFRMVVGGSPAQVSSLKGDISGFKVSADGSRLLVWADRDLRCADFACDGLPKAEKGGSGRVYDQLFVRHWDTWAEPGVRSRIFAFPIADGGDRRRRAGDRRAGRRHAVQAVRRRRGDRMSPPTAAPSISRCARPAGSSRTRPISTSSRRPPTARPSRPTSPPTMTAPTICRHCRPTAAASPISRWRAPATRPTARCCSCAISPPARSAR